VARSHFGFICLKRQLWLSVAKYNVTELPQ
jgi:hypothetical protein